MVCGMELGMQELGGATFVGTVSIVVGDCLMDASIALSDRVRKGSWMLFARRRRA